MTAGTTTITKGALRDRLDMIQSRALAASGIGLVVSLAACWLWPARSLPAYLVAYVFWVGLAQGCLGLTMLHHLTGGSWGLVVRRPMELGGMLLLPLALLFLPIALGLPALYPWARSHEVVSEPALQYKSDYLSPSFYLGRTAAYFVIW